MAGFLDQYDPDKAPEAKKPETSFLDQYDPALSPPQGTDYGRLAKMGGSALLAGAENLAGGIGTTRELIGAGAEKLGLPAWVAPAASAVMMPGFGAVAPSAATLRGLSAEAGLTDNPAFAPQTPGEHYVASALEAIPTAAVGMATGMGPISSFLSSVGSGVAGEAVRQAKLGLPAEIGAGILGGFGVGAARSLTKLGSVEKAVSQIGASSTMQQAGEHLQDSVRDWLTKVLPSKENKVWSEVDKLIPQDTPTPLPNFRKALGELSAEMGDLSPIGKSLVPQLPAEMAKKFDQVFDSVAGKAAKPASQIPSAILDASGNRIIKTVPGTPAEPIQWSDVRALRSAIGQAMADPTTVTKIGPRQLDKMYAAITADLGEAAKAKSVDAAKAFDTANAESSRLRSLAEGPIAKLVKGPDKSFSDPTPEVAAGRMLAEAKKGGSTLSDLRGEIPKSVDELAAAIIRGDKWRGLSHEGKMALVPQGSSRRVFDSASVVQTPPIQQAAHGIGSIVGSEFGRVLGAPIQHLLGTGPVESADIGAALGLLAPMAGRGGLALARNPSAGILPALGVQSSTQR